MPQNYSPAQEAKWKRAAAKPSVIKLHFLGEPAPQGSKIQTRYGGMKEASKRSSPGVRQFSTPAMSNTRARC